MRLDKTIALTAGERVWGIVWQHVLLCVALWVMTLGVVLCVRSQLGSSVISSAPLAFTLAGEAGKTARLSLGVYTNILNVLLVVGQIAVLGRRFHVLQLLQLAVGCVFGAMIDMNMALTAPLACDAMWQQGLAQLCGCTLLAFGVAMEVRCGSITMPGEGLPVAISRRTGAPFAKVKIWVDMGLVVLAVSAAMLFFGRWLWNVVGFGTLFAMFYVGLAVKWFSPHMKWFDRLLSGGRPGFRRVLYGLARFLPRGRK